MTTELDIQKPTRFDTEDGLVQAVSLDLPSLRAQYEAATAGEWTNERDDNRAGWRLINGKPWEIARRITLQDADHIVTMHNTYAALLDRAEQADKYELIAKLLLAVLSDQECLRAALAGDNDAVNLINDTLADAREALEKSDA